jgi:hypothetical protein
LGLKEEIKEKLLIKVEAPLFGEKDEAINTLTLEVKILTEELEATIENLRDLLQEIKKS